MQRSCVYLVALTVWIHRKTGFQLAFVQPGANEPERARPHVSGVEPHQSWRCCDRRAAKPPPSPAALSQGSRWRLEPASPHGAAHNEGLGPSSRSSPTLPVLQTGSISMLLWRTSLTSTYVHLLLHLHQFSISVPPLRLLTSQTSGLEIWMRLEPSNTLKPDPDFLLHLWALREGGRENRQAKRLQRADRK